MKTKLQTLAIISLFTFWVIGSSACGSLSIPTQNPNQNRNQNQTVSQKRSASSAVSKAMQGLTAARTRLTAPRSAGLIKVSAISTTDSSDYDYDTDMEETQQADHSSDPTDVDHGYDYNDDNDHDASYDSDEDLIVDEIDFACDVIFNDDVENFEEHVVCRGACNEDGSGLLEVTMYYEGDEEYEATSVNVAFTNCYVESCDGQIKVTGTGSIDFDSSCNAAWDMSLIAENEAGERATIVFDVSLDLSGEGESCSEQVSCEDYQGNVTVNGQNFNAAEICETETQANSCTIDSVEVDSEHSSDASDEETDSLSEGDDSSHEDASHEDSSEEESSSDYTPPADYEYDPSVM